MSVQKEVQATDFMQCFTFHGIFPEQSSNGLCFNNVYLPQEVVSIILNFIDVKELLKATLVCRRWCNVIKSHSFWFRKYTNVYKEHPKKFPWYIYYCLFTTNYFRENLLKNGNGQEGFNHWQIVLNGGDHFRIENPPAGSDPLPSEAREFRGKNSCFATSFRSCRKKQVIPLNRNLIHYIMDHFKPHIYLSEWIAGRFDCGCVYTLVCSLCGGQVDDSVPQEHFVGYFTPSEDRVLHCEETSTQVLQFEGSAWYKVELLVKDYPAGVRRIVFEHEGTDTQFWKGHYGSKMAGGVVRLLFESLEPC